MLVEEFVFWANASSDAVTVQISKKASLMIMYSLLSQFGDVTESGTTQQMREYINCARG